MTKLLQSSRAVKYLLIVNSKIYFCESVRNSDMTQWYDTDTILLSVAMTRMNL